MEILEGREAWIVNYQSTWLDHYQKTGETKWDIYPKPNNKTAPSGKGIDLSQSRLMLISSAGSYLKASQEAYDASNLLGDYTTRIIPMDTAFDALAYSHEHYDHTAVDEDPQVLVPLQHLKDMVAEGKIGSLAQNYVSFSGYMPDMVRVIDETIPAIMEAVKMEQADAALLVPS